MSLKKELDDCGVCNSCDAHDGLSDYDASDVFGARELANVPPFLAHIVCSFKKFFNISYASVFISFKSLWILIRGGIHQFSEESRLSRLFKSMTQVALSGSCNSPKRDSSRVFHPESCFSIILTRVKI